MKYIKYLMLIGLIFVFTGCTHKMEYNKSYIETNLKKEIKQVSIEKVDLKKKEAVFLNKSPNSFNGGGSKLEINLTSINENVQNEFFKQYFKEVNYVNETTNNLFIDSTLYNYEYLFDLGNGTNMELFVKIKVYYKNKIILDKEYYIKDRKVMIATFRMSMGEITGEVFQKTLFKLYETQFKPDLLKALEENQ